MFRSLCWHGQLCWQQSSLSPSPAHHHTTHAVLLSLCPAVLLSCPACCATTPVSFTQAFEESQGKLEEELAARTAKEIALREEAEAKKAAEEAERRYAAWPDFGAKEGGSV